MDNPIVRTIVASLAGIAVAILVVFLAEGAGHLIFPPPDGLDVTNAADQVRIMEVIPLGAKIAVVVAWFLGALAGAAVAIMIGSRALPAWIVGLAMLLASVATTQMFPHPLWMLIAAFALPIVAVLLALRMFRARLKI
ncbi:MAG: hypothetical protein HKN78_02025 [Sphingomonadaceae bacterium]|nr:hypothetical protein [Sphingomonadaceae bacterium]